MTTGQAAKVLGVSPDNITHLIRSGQLRAAKAGSKWLVAAADVKGHRELGRLRPR